MYKKIILIFVFLYSAQSLAQGPPITSDKPIMLAANNWVFRTLVEVRTTNEGAFSRTPLMVHYLPTSKLLLAAHLPFMSYDFNSGNRGQGLGDVELLAKYQFYRKDGMAKTFRMVAKSLQTFPTGEAIGIEGISTGIYQNYVGVVAGYESIKYGISNELGYNITKEKSLRELRHKLGFGLPLLKPIYPVNQINLYFEYTNGWFPSMDEYMLLYAQGIQYAKGQFTIETAVQFPLIQDISENRKRKMSIFLGSRYVF